MSKFTAIKLLAVVLSVFSALVAMAADSVPLVVR
jgi:hypothetical protein